MANVASLIKALQEVPDLSAEVRQATPLVTEGDFTGGTTEDIFVLAAHGLVAGDALLLQHKDAAGVLTGISAGDIVYVIATGLTSANFSVSATAGGSIIENTADGTAVFSNVTDAAVDATNAASSTPAGEGPSNPNASPAPGYVLVG